MREREHLLVSLYGLDPRKVFSPEEAGAFLERFGIDIEVLKGLNRFDVFPDRDDPLWSEKCCLDPALGDPGFVVLAWIVSGRFEDDEVGLSWRELYEILLR